MECTLFQVDHDTFIFNIVYPVQEQYKIINIHVYPIYSKVIPYYHQQWNLLWKSSTLE